MIREGSLEEISDGRLYGPNDMVKVGTLDCAGCSVCCRGMGHSLVLDPMDIYRLTTHLQRGFMELMEDAIELHVVDGVILPNLRMAGSEEACVFLNEQERCAIHAFRPGFCRLFPLGRYYEEDGFHYILQVHECAKKNRMKMKVSKWLDTPQLPRYEKYVLAWHRFLKKMQATLNTCEEAEAKEWQMTLLRIFFLTPYVKEEDFYLQFEARLEEAERTIG